MDPSLPYSQGGLANAPTIVLPPEYVNEVIRDRQIDDNHRINILSPLSNEYVWPLAPPARVNDVRPGSYLAESAWTEIDIFDLWRSGTEPTWPTLHQIHSRCRQSRADRGRSSRYRRSLPALEEGDMDLISDRLENLLSSLEKRRPQFPSDFSAFWVVSIIDLARAIKGQDHSHTRSAASTFAARYEICVSHFLHVFSAGLDASVASLASYNTLAWVIHCLPVRGLLEHETVARAFGCPNTQPARPPNRYGRLYPSNSNPPIGQISLSDLTPHPDYNRVVTDPPPTHARQSLVRDIPLGLPPTNLARVAAAPPPIIVKSAQPVERPARQKADKAARRPLEELGVRLSDVERWRMRAQSTGLESWSRGSGDDFGAADDRSSPRHLTAGSVSVEERDISRSLQESPSHGSDSPSLDRVGPPVGEGTGRLHRQNGTPLNNDAVGIAAHWTDRASASVPVVSRPTPRRARAACARSPSRIALSATFP